MSISTLAISRRLEAKGFTESQAEGVAEELIGIVENSDLVTKDFLRAEMGELRGELRAEMAGLETKLMAKIGDVKTDLIAKIGETKTDTIKWLISLQFASLALTVGLIYFLLKH